MRLRVHRHGDKTKREKRSGTGGLLNYLFMHKLTESSTHSLALLLFVVVMLPPSWETLLLIILFCIVRLFAVVHSDK